MTLTQRIKICVKELNKLFRKTIGPLVVFLFLYYLVTKFILFPIGRGIWSRALSTLPDGYIALNNVGDLASHPMVIVVGFILALIYCLITFFQIECAFTFVEYRYNDKIIGFGNLITHVVKRTIKAVYPRNWPMILLVVIVIPFVNVFSVSADINSISVPEFIYTVITQQTRLFIAYSVFQLVLLYVVLKGLYVEITFTHQGKNFRQAFKDSARLTKGFLNKLEKLAALIFVRIASLVLFSIVPAILASIVHFVCKAIFGDSPTFNPTMEILENNVAYPAIMAFSTAMTCAVIITLIVIWFHTDSERFGEEQPDVQEYSESKFVEKISRTFTSKVFAIVIGACMALYCIMIPVCVQVLTNNTELLLKLSEPTEIIAHKGYTAKAPENTIPAMEEAIKCGNATIVEFDVQATKDGVPVVIHDPNASAVTGVDKNICNMNLSEVKQLDAAHSFKGNKYKNIPIPTLEEYLKACDHRIKLLLEIKNYNNDPNLEREIVSILKKYDYLDGSCMIHSGSVDSLKKVKKLNSDISCGFIMTVAIGTYYDIPYADFFSIESSFISLPTTTEIHKRFKRVFAWTVDDQKVVEEMVYADADGIICDDPDLVKGYLDYYTGDLIEYSNKQVLGIFDKYMYMLDNLQNQDKEQKVNTQYGD